MGGRRWFLSLAALAAMVAPAGAQPTTGGESALVQAERDWMAAMVRRDARALGDRLDPGFTLSGTTELGREPLAGAAWLENALRHLDVRSFDFETIRAEEKGDVGIVRAAFRWRGAYDGEPFDDGGTLVDVWRRRGGRWTVVARVITAETPPPADASRAAARSLLSPRWNGEPILAP